MAYFHYKCGERITLTNGSCTAERNDGDFDHGLVVTAEPLANDVLFEIKIDRKVSSWSGSLEIGVIETDPLNFEFPACASKIHSGAWIMSSTSVYHNGTCLIEHYGMDLDKLNQEDRIGVVRTSEGDLMFYINGESLGVAAEGLPPIVFGIVDLYGKCVQVTITNPLGSRIEHNNDDCLSGSSVLAIDNDTLNVTLGGDLSELSLSSSNSLDVRMDLNMSLNVSEEVSRLDRVRFHNRCGTLVKLSNGNRTAERRRPLDEFNNGVVMTHRSLQDNELFEIRIDRLVDKWSGSIEMGLTTHNPSSLDFPATMTNMRSGTIMMSGCGILTNGKGTRREYGEFNLDELSEGDRVGMMRKSNGDLHYFINGLDQGIAAQRIPQVVWGVIDLYGMTIKVSIVERDEREEQNLIARRQHRQNELDSPEPLSNLSLPLEAPSPYQNRDRLTFHPNCGSHAQVVNNGRVARRPNATDDFNNAVVLTSRSLHVNELFEIRLEKVVGKWAGSIEIGVTTHSPDLLEFPFTMTNVRSGTWMMTGCCIVHNGTVILEQYGNVNLDRLQAGNRVGVKRKENGCLHFFVNGVDQGVAASNIPEEIYGAIDLYGQAVEASIVDFNDFCSPDTINSSLSNTTLYGDLRFYHLHGKNVRITNNGLTALRPRPLAEFNDAIVFSSRSLKDNEIFEITVESIVDRWSGSIELGITAVRPDDIELPSTATDLCQYDTWMLSGTSIMRNGKTVRNGYALDLDSVDQGVSLGVQRTSDKKLLFYRDGICQGVAAQNVDAVNAWAVVDLYGMCAKVSITAQKITGQVLSPVEAACPGSDTSQSLQANFVAQSSEPDLHRFSEHHNNNITLSQSGRLATKKKECTSGIIFSSEPLTVNEMYEISIVGLQTSYWGTICIGVTSSKPSVVEHMPDGTCFLTGNELHYDNEVQQLFAPSFHWLAIGDHIGILRTQDSFKVYLNGDEMIIKAPKFSGNLYAIFNIRGSCTAISVVSHKTLLSPINSVKMQDSLEDRLNFEQEEAKQMTQSKIEEKLVCSISEYKFSENCGDNVEINEDKITARRNFSYNHGITIAVPALNVNVPIKVLIEQVDTNWESSLIVGIVTGSPDKVELASSSINLKGNCCVISEDYVLINGIKTKSSYGQCLSNLEEGDVIGISITNDGNVILSKNNLEGKHLSVNLPKGVPVYALFDMYGQCQQIKLLNKETSVSDLPDLTTPTGSEKWETENFGKIMYLPISSPCTNLPESEPIKSRPISPLGYLNCNFRAECEKFKNRMLLSDDYFIKDQTKCYCHDCCNAIQSDNHISCLGWVKFPLRNEANVQENWHIAYYPTKVGLVKYILENGQPFTKGQSEWGPLVPRKKEDVLIIFYPSLKNCTIPLINVDNKEVRAVFQLLVKPGAYSISQEPLEWNTKESGAIILQSLLIKVNVSV